VNRSKATYKKWVSETLDEPLIRQIEKLRNTKDVKHVRIMPDVLSDMDETWTAALLARNVTDERILGFSNNVPLSASQYGAPTYYGFFEPGRTVALQLQYKY
jgi:hypothetical protein